MRKLKRPGAFLAAVVPASFLLASINPSSVIFDPAPTASHPPLRHAHPAAPGPAALPPHSIVLTVESGDTLATLLADGGVDGVEGAALVRDVARTLELRRLRPGNLVRFHYQPDGR